MLFWRGFVGIRANLISSFDLCCYSCGEDGVDEHTCFNGSQCKKERTEKGEAYYRCECDVAHSDMSASYAGKYCEHASTTFCNRNKEDSDFGGSTAFCTNGGKCKPKLVTETA